MSLTPIYTLIAPKWTSSALLPSTLQPQTRIFNDCLLDISASFSNRHLTPNKSKVRCSSSLSLPTSAFPFPQELSWTPVLLSRPTSNPSANPVGCTFKMHLELEPRLTRGSSVPNPPSLLSSHLLPKPSDVTWGKDPVWMCIFLGRRPILSSDPQEYP